MPKSKKTKVPGTQSLEDFVAGVDKKSPGFAQAYRMAYTKHGLARAVKALRERRGLSQRQLAELVDTQQPQIARLENGVNIPRLDVLQKIARALGTELEVTFTDAAAPT